VTTTSCVDVDAVQCVPITATLASQTAHLCATPASATSAIVSEAARPVNV